MLIINEDWCKGCGICIERCPVQALEESDTLNRRGIHPPRLKPENNCNYCRLCELICPDLAIAVIPDKNSTISKSLKKSRLRPVGGKIK